MPPRFTQAAYTIDRSWRNVRTSDGEALLQKRCANDILP